MLPKVKMLQILKTATNEILGEILSIKGVVIWKSVKMTRCTHNLHLIYVKYSYHAQDVIWMSCVR